MNKISRIIIVIAFVLFFSLMTVHGDVFADNTDKIDAYYMWRCYGLNGVLKDEITLEQAKSYEALFNNDKAGFVYQKTTVNNINNDTISCKDLVKKVKGKLSFSKDNRRDSLTKLEYVPESGGRCFTIQLSVSQYRGDDEGGYTVPKIKSVASLCSKDGSPSGIQAERMTAGDFIYFNRKGNELQMYMRGKRKEDGSIEGDWAYYDLSKINSMDALKTSIYSDMKLHFGKDPNCQKDSTIFNQGIDSVTSYMACTPLDIDTAVYDEGGESSENVIFHLPSNRALAGLKAAGYDNVEKTAYSNNEKYTLYYDYLNNIYGINNSGDAGGGMRCGTDLDSIRQQSPGPEWRLGAFSKNGKWQACWVVAHSHQNDKVNALDGNNYFVSKKTWQELVDDLLNTFQGEIGDETQVPEEGINDDGDASNDACYDAGIDGVSWIVCPMINNLTDTADEMDKTINTLLSIDSKDYGYGSKVEGFWKEMVKIANVAVIIILLVIIVSQITGFGIDNYGIKKMLPKLLIMAILINFSFVICVLAVDLSNIFGEGLNQLFSGIGHSISGGEQNAVTGFFGTIITLIFTVAGVGSLIGPLGVMSIFTVLLALIAVVFGVLLFFFSLGARMMLVILCIGISPLAFACYILPNTQILFKKWWDIFKAALLLFPICGALSGISIIIREIGSSSDNVMMMVISMISVVIPYYALPVLLKSALSAMPAIGAAVSSFTNAVRGGVRSGSDMFRNSDTYKEAQERAIRNNALGKVGFYRNRLNDPNNAATRSRDLQRLAKYQRVTASMSQQGIKNYETAFSDMDRGTIQSSLSDALKGNGADADLRASGAIKALIAQGGIEEAINELSNADWSRMGANVSKAVVDAMATSGIDIFSGFAKYRNTGGKGGLKEWSDGSIRQSEANVAGIKGRTLAEHLSENGPNAFNSYSKDEMKHIEKYKDSLRSQMGETNFGTAVSNAAISGKDAKTQTVAENIVKSELADGNLKSSDLGITADKIGSMRDSFATAIKEGLEQYPANQNVTNVMKENFSQQITAVQNDPNILNKTSNGVRETFGLGSSASGGGQSGRDPLSGYSEESRRAIEQNGGSLGV